MAFPSATGSVSQTLDEAWRGARAVAANVKNQTAALASACGAGPVNAKIILDYASFLAAAYAQLTAFAAVPNIAAYAQTQINNPSFDVVSAFNTMMSAMQATSQWVITNFPKDGNGNILGLTFNGDGSQGWTSFTTAQTAGLVSQLGLLSNTIN